jgi:hypothetical protein
LETGASGILDAGENLGKAIKFVSEFAEDAERRKWNLTKIVLECNKCGKRFERDMSYDDIRNFLPVDPKNKDESKKDEVEWHTLGMCPKCRCIQQVKFISGKTPFIFR